MNILLKPFSILYGSITAIRNKRYDEGKTRIVSFSIPIISVGNLSVGGTGKTPFVEFLITKFQKEYELGVLSRGYGRKTKGPLYATEDATAKSIGDEPMQYHSKYDNIEVVVSEQRVLGVPLFHNANLLILDDAYQHRAINRDVNIMLSDFNKPFFEDEVLPLGRLRENREGASRADIIIFTKVNEVLEDKVVHRFITLTKKYAPNSVVFFTSIVYGKVYNLENPSEHVTLNQKVNLMTSIANPTPLVDHLENELDIEINKHFKFRDHYSFTEKTIDRIEKEIGPDQLVLITEKDAVKLKPLVGESTLRFVVIPIIPKVLLEQEDQLLTSLRDKLSDL